jgi:peroxiredoxin (alkyl hydroperoxide reductase subunit C)
LTVIEWNRAAAVAAAGEIEATVPTSPTLPRFTTPPTVLIADSGQWTAALPAGVRGCDAVLAIDTAGFLREVIPLRSSADLAALVGRLPQLVEGLQRRPIVGQTAPAFCMRDMNGNLQSLAQRRGRRNVLLTFFPKCFTGGCTSHLAAVQREYKSLHAVAGAQTDVLAVSVDAAGGATGQRAFAKSLGLGYPLIPDTGRNLCVLYGAAHNANQLAARMSVLIDKTGTVRWIDRQVNVKTHGQDVLNKLHELGMASLR